MQLVEFNTNTLDNSNVKLFNLAIEELEDSISKLDNSISMVNKYQDVTADIEDKIVTMQKNLESPETITPATVVMATESLKWKLKYLNIPLKNSKAINTISKESIIDSPAMVYQIALEDNETLLANIKHKMEELFEYVKNMLESIINKLNELLSSVDLKIRIITLKNAIDNRANEHYFEERLESLINEGLIKGYINLGLLYEFNGGNFNQYIKKKCDIAYEYSNNTTYQSLVPAYERLTILIKEVIKTAGMEKYYDVDYNKYYLFDISPDNKLFLKDKQTFETIIITLNTDKSGNVSILEKGSMNTSNAKKLIDTIPINIKEIATQIEKIKNGIDKLKRNTEMEVIGQNERSVIEDIIKFNQNTTVSLAKLASHMTKSIKYIGSNLSKKSPNAGLSGDKKRIYQYNKTNIENFIRRKNWEALENMLDSRPLQDFPDLDKMVKDALKNRN